MFCVVCDQMESTTFMENSEPLFLLESDEETVGEDGIGSALVMRNVANGEVRMSRRNGRLG